MVLHMDESHIDSATIDLFFDACRTNHVSGVAAALPAGRGIVSFSDDADQEVVIFPATQLELELHPEEIGRLERANLAERTGSPR